MKPIQLDLPYPPLDCIGCDFKSAKIIFPAYTSAHGELTAILQYIYHSLRFGEQCDGETARVLTGICPRGNASFQTARRNADQTRRRSRVHSGLPATPFNFYSTGAVCYSKSVKKMLMDDLSGEIYAAESYGKMLCRLCNEEVAAVIARIKMDEELHVQVLKERMNALFCGC